MQLTSFRVRNFRNILDSGAVAVDESVTCLVGMNESGKTAALSALHRLNPVDGSTFDEQRDYPRGLLSRDRRGNPIGDAEPATATFTRRDADPASPDAPLGLGLCRSRGLPSAVASASARMQWSGIRDSRQAVGSLLGHACIRQKIRSTATCMNWAAFEHRPARSSVTADQ